MAKTTAKQVGTEQKDTANRSLATVPVANDKLYEDVARMSKLNKGSVQNIIHFVGNYIHKTITDGSMEGVMIPYFGKFKPKMIKIRMAKQTVADRRSGLEIVNRAILGKEKLRTYAKKEEVEDVQPL